MRSIREALSRTSTILSPSSTKMRDYLSSFDFNKIRASSEDGARDAAKFGSHINKSYAQIKKSVHGIGTIKDHYRNLADFVFPRIDQSVNFLASEFTVSSTAEFFKVFTRNPKFRAIIEIAESLLLFYVEEDQRRKDRYTKFVEGYKKEGYEHSFMNEDLVDMNMESYQKMMREFGLTTAEIWDGVSNYGSSGGNLSDVINPNLNVDNSFMKTFGVLGNVTSMSFSEITQKAGELMHNFSLAGKGSADLLVNLDYASKDAAVPQEKYISEVLSSVSHTMAFGQSAMLTSRMLQVLSKEGGRGKRSFDILNELRSEDDDQNFTTLYNLLQKKDTLSLSFLNLAIKDLGLKLEGLSGSKDSKGYKAVLAGLNYLKSLKDNPDKMVSTTALFSVNEMLSREVLGIGNLARVLTEYSPGMVLAKADQLKLPLGMANYFLKEGTGKLVEYINNMSLVEGAEAPDGYLSQLEEDSRRVVNDTEFFTERFAKMVEDWRMGTFTGSLRYFKSLFSKGIELLDPYINKVDGDLPDTEDKKIPAKDKKTYETPLDVDPIPLNTPKPETPKESSPSILPVTSVGSSVVHSSAEDIGITNTKDSNFNLDSYIPKDDNLDRIAKENFNKVLANFKKEFKSSKKYKVSFNNKETFEKDELERAMRRKNGDYSKDVSR